MYEKFDNGRILIWELYSILNSMGTIFPDSVMLSRNMSSCIIDLSCKPFIKGDEGLPTVMKCLPAVLQM